MPLDSYQQRAVVTTGKNIVVSASAGAGKTSVLVSRLVKRCVDDHIPISRILAVTFTAAAASEMKKRLTASLYEKMQTANAEEAAYLKEQIVDLETAQITTIDSFCLSIIQKYYNVIGLDPATSQNILSEGLDEAYRMDAYHLAMEEMYQAKKENLVQLLYHYSTASYNYDVLYDSLKKINQLANNAINPTQWYENAKASYASIQQFKQLPPLVYDTFFQMLDTNIQNMEEALNSMMLYYQESEKLIKKEELLFAKQNALQNVKNALADRNYPFFVEQMKFFAEQKTPADGKALLYTSYRKTMEADTKSLLQNLFDEKTLVQDSNDCASLCSDVIDLAQSMNTHFQQIKKDHACMDFSDMERYALAILEQNNGEVANLLRDSLDEIMIDEFQDTSILQNEIIDRIAKKDNTFRVGDVKQSIYRFRQAKPSLMRNLMKNPDTERITLIHNYRSKDSIVRFTNLLFQKLMNVEGIQDTYADEDIVTIGNPDSQAEPSPVPVSFIHVNPTLPKDEQEGTKEDDGEQLPSKIAKATFIANQIVKEMQENPNLTFHDFAVLVKGHADKIYLRRAFDRAGIAYDLDAKEGFYQSEVCQTILAFLRVMLDHNDQLALLTLLTSHYFHFNDEQLAQLKIQYGSIAKGIHEAYPQIGQEIQELEQMAQTEGVMVMLSEIAKRNNFFAKLPITEQANFDFLFEQMNNQEVLTISDLYKLMSISEDEKSAEANSTGKSDNVVTVTTIHHSKGLQYKYVFLWSTSRNTAKDSKEAVLLDDELYLGFYHYNGNYRNQRPTIQRMASTFKANLEDIEEFTRLLYVAITRAESRLFIVDADVPKNMGSQPITLSLLMQRKGMTGLILSALDEGPLFEIKHVPVLEAARIQNAQPANAFVSHLKTWEKEVPQLVEMYSPSSTETTYLPPLDLQQKHGTSYGTKMHEILAELPNRMWTEDDLASYDIYPTDKERILAFAQSDLYQQALQGTIYHEYPFFIHTEEVHMNGIMDFVSFCQDMILLIDYKTDNCSLQEIQNRYTTQLNAYRKALSILQPDTPILVYAWSLHHCQAIAIPEE